MNESPAPLGASLDRLPRRSPQLLDLSDELLVEIISYFAGKERVLDKRYYYPSMDIEYNWYRLPDLSTLASLCRTNRHLRALARPAFYAFVGTPFPPNTYKRNMQLQLACWGSQDFASNLRHFSVSFSTLGLSEQLGILNHLQLECLEIKFDLLFMLADAHEHLRSALRAVAKYAHFREPLRTVRFNYSAVTDIYSASHWIHPILLFSRSSAYEAVRHLPLSQGDWKPQPFALEIVGIGDDKEDVEESEDSLWDKSIAYDLAKGPFLAFTTITFIDCRISPLSANALFRILAGDKHVAHLAFLGCQSGLDDGTAEGPTFTRLGTPWLLFDFLPPGQKAKLERLAIHQELGTSTREFPGGTGIPDPSADCLGQLRQFCNLRTLVTDNLPNATDLPASLERLRVSDTGHVETLSHSLLSWTEILEAKISNTLPNLAELIIEIRHDRGLSDLESRRVHPTQEDLCELERRYAAFRTLPQKAEVLVSGHLAEVMQERLAWGRMLARMESMNETLAESEGASDMDISSW